MKMNYVVETNNLKKKYRNVKALDGLSIKVQEGSIHALVGPNGSGKTTMIRILMGTTVPTQGSFSLFGHTETREVIKQRRRIGTLIEVPQFYNDKSAYENLNIIRQIRGIDGTECIAEVLSIVGLLGEEKRKVGMYSLGMRQRLGIAKALLGNPELLILDEPINGMDPQGVSEIRTLLFQLKEQGCTIMLASHILKELSVVATHYSMIRNGKIFDSFSASELSKRCGEWTEIVTKDTEKATGILREFCERIEVERNVIKIYDSIEVSKIIKKLVFGGCEINSVGKRTNDLESYFIHMMEEKV